MNKYLVSIVVVLAIALGLVVINKPQDVPVVGSAGSDYTNTVNFFGGLTQGSGATAYSSTTDATFSVTRAEMERNSVISLATTSIAAITLTLPSNADMNAILPTVGQVRQWAVVNNTGSTTLAVTLAAGAELDLQEPDDTSDFNVVFSDMGWLTCLRRSTASTTCEFRETTPAD